MAPSSTILDGHTQNTHTHKRKLCAKQMMNMEWQRFRNWYLNAVVCRNAMCSIRYQCGWISRSIGFQYIEFKHTADNSWLNETFNHVIVFTWFDGCFENDPGKCEYNRIEARIQIIRHMCACGTAFQTEKCVPNVRTYIDILHAPPLKLKLSHAKCHRNPIIPTTKRN